MFLCSFLYALYFYLCLFALSYYTIYFVFGQTDIHNNSNESTDILTSSPKSHVLIKLEKVLENIPSLY